MSDLKEFQLAAVGRICERLDPKNGGSGRFLLADEVGLGKTMVARGVLDALDDRKRGQKGKGLVCVYLCSNLEIAEQNRDKLSDDKAHEPPTRLTLITLRAKSIQTKRQGKKRERQLFLFTPGTSLNLGGATGIMAERRLLLACLYGWQRQKVVAKIGDWIEFFRCGAGHRSIKAKQQWEGSCHPTELRRELNALRRSGLYRKVIGRWGKASVAIQQKGQKRRERIDDNLLDAIGGCVSELTTVLTGGLDTQANEIRVKRNRNAAIGALRKGVAEAALDFLAPDVILVDEFQRFKEVIKLADQGTDLAGRLFEGSGKRPRVLVLSATPYKAVTFDHEKEDHYRDFQDTLSFLLGKSPNKKEWLEEVNSLLLEFKAKLTEQDVDFPALITVKDRLEDRLKEVMCRTERSRYLIDEHKGVEERPDPSRDEPFAVPSSESLSEFVSLRSFLQRHEKERPFPSIMDFWKSCSSVVTFMDSGYEVIKHLKADQIRVDPKLLRPESTLKGLTGKNLKMQTLANGLREPCQIEESSSKRWRFLWARPTYLYYRDAFFGTADPTKFLVFSRWRFVPKAISFIISSEFESSPKAQSHVLELNSESLKVCLPLVCLADVVDPAEWATGQRQGGASEDPPAAKLRKHVKSQLKKLFEEAGIKVSKKAGRKRFWPALFELERWYLLNQADAHLKPSERILPEIYDVLEQAVESGPNTGESLQAQTFMRAIKPWTKPSKEHLEFPKSMMGDLVTVVLSSPAVCLLRAVRSMFCESVGEVLPPVARVCFQSLRTYFNKGYVQESVGQHARSGRYADQVLRYCFDAHFQSVIDEYAYLLRRVLGRKDVTKCAEHIGRVLALGPGTPNINVPVGPSGRIKEKRSQRPVNFAIAFGDDAPPAETAKTRASRKTPEETAENRASRKTAVRESFNSPFWPFVLATTSIGQEGLDFHLYCRDVMHWNLPSNPVDLEQREGRINRFDGLVVRGNVRKDYPLSAIPLPGEGRSNLWDRVFQQIEEHPQGNQHFKHGLFPHWVFEPVDGEPLRIRRHLAIFEGSRDRKHYERLKRYIFYYRLAFGQARQQDLLDKIVDRPDEARIRAELHACMINLSPFSDDHSWQKAQRDARELVGKPDRLRMVIEQTHTLFAGRSNELRDIEPDLNALWEVAKRITVKGETDDPEDLRSVAALIYLLNPYDAKFDGMAGVGFQDDMAVVRMAATARREQSRAHSETERQ